MTEMDHRAAEVATKYTQTTGRAKLVSRALKAVQEGRVKKHEFLPSKRVLFTVVGRSGDEFVDPEKPFCSCEDFFFTVLGGRSLTCYHLLAYAIADEAGKFSEARFHDEEFSYFIELLSADLLTRMGDKEDKQSRDRSDTVPR